MVIWVRYYHMVSSNHVVLLRGITVPKLPSGIFLVYHAFIFGWERRATEIVKGIGKLSYDEKVRKLGLRTLEQRRKRVKEVT